MIENSLPLCPCGSGNLYEECCYKKKGANGEPLYFKGAVTSKDGGNTWHPVPNIKFAAIIVGQEIDKFRECAKSLVTKTILDKKHHEKFINLYGLFYRSFEQLLHTCQTPFGKGVAFQMDTIEVRYCWKDFLFNGRILLDFIGLHSKMTLGLNQDIGGLNERKFELLLKILQELGTRDKHFLGLKAELEPLKNDIVTFIKFRDREKLASDTIVDFPAIDSEYGLVKDGTVSLDGYTFNMIGFTKQSRASIDKLVLILLGNSH